MIPFQDVDAAEQVEPARPPQTPLSANEAQILKLVAADVPSHRGAWTKEGKAWQTFISRRGGEGQHQVAGGIDEEDEDVDEDADWEARQDAESTDDEDEDVYVQRGESSTSLSWTRIDDVSPSGADILGDLSPGLPRSLPVAIRSLAGVERPAYQPKTSLADRPGVLVPALHNAGVPSSAAVRRAAYAERDLRRSMDPGALDFAAADDDDEPGTPGEGDGQDATGGRGRQRALRILQARSEIPDAGMWRSLA